jgi:hypothetical protein
MAEQKRRGRPPGGGKPKLDAASGTKVPDPDHLERSGDDKAGRDAVHVPHDPSQTPLKDPTETGKPQPQADVIAKGRPEGTQPEPPTALVEELDVVGPGRLPTDHSGSVKVKEHYNANPEQLLTQQGPNQPPSNFPEGTAEREYAEAEKLGDKQRADAQRESDEGTAEQYRRDPMVKRAHEENRRIIEELEEEGHRQRVAAIRESEKGEAKQDKKTPEQARRNEEALKERREEEIRQHEQRVEAERVSNEAPQPLETNLRLDEPEAEAKRASAKPKMVEIQLNRKYAPFSWEDPETGEVRTQQGEIMQTFPEGTTLKVSEKDARRALHTNNIASPSKAYLAGDDL